MIDVSQLNDRDPVQDYIKMNNEMGSFSNDLKNKPQIVVLSKTDIIQDEESINKIEDYFSNKGVDVFKISAITGDGLPALKDEIIKNLELLKPESTEDSEFPFP